MAIKLNSMISAHPGPYDKRKRSIAQCIGVVSPESTLVRTLLGEAREAARKTDEKADVMASSATIAIVNVDEKQLKACFEQLRRRLTQSEDFYSVIVARPMTMTINNAIGEMFYLGLTALHFNDFPTASEAGERLDLLIHSQIKANRFISPPVWEGCWDQILQTARASKTRERMIRIVREATPPHDSYRELIGALGEVSAELFRHH